MNIQVLSWAGLVVILCISTFGLSFCLVYVIAISFFVLGIFTFMYVSKDDSKVVFLEKETHKLEQRLLEVVSAIKMPKQEWKIDKRLTGSHVIDEQLQEILYFIMRDYIYPWYDQVSDNDEFSNKIRIGAQQLIIAFANRMKELDWTPYLTTQLVDDAATHLRLYRRAKARAGAGSLEEAFFDLELAMEQNLVCRDHVSMHHPLMRSFLQELSDVVLFLLAPEAEFRCLPLRLIIRELLVNIILIPLIKKLSDPDYINRLIIWLCKDIPITSDVFLTVLRVTDSVDELIATKELLNKEILTLRSRDAGGESDKWIKEQLSSLLYVEKIVDVQVSRLQEGGDFSGPTMDYYKMIGSGTKLFQLPLDVIIKNNIALSYFIDYMTSSGLQNYVYFYLNVEGWKASTEQQLCDMGGGGKSGSMLAEQYSQTRQAHQRITEAAASIFELYLSEQGAAKIKLDESIVKKLLNNIRTEKPSENWFDETQASAFEKMQEEVSGFRGWSGYVKLLAELDLLRENSRSDEDDTRSLDEVSLGSDSQSLTDYTTHLNPSPGVSEGDAGSGGSPVHLTQDSKPAGPFTLNAEIIETGIVHEKGKTYGIYAVSVSKKYENGHKESWHIYRRYSDFFELYQKIKDKFPELSKVSFPGKKTFHNMERRTLERRMVSLNTWLVAMTRPSLLLSKPGLIPLLVAFLAKGDYDKRAPSHFGRTLDSLFRVSMQAVRTVPESVLSSVDGVVDGLTRVLQVRTAKDLPNMAPPDTNKVGPPLDIETGDNIPLRILLLLMTEVFELKASQQWLRRRVVTLLRQILRTMFGDIVNKRIVDFVSLMTSPTQVATYLRSFKESFWPNGVRSEPSPPRDHNTKMRTRVAAKVALLSSLSDELKHILGSETSRYGMLSVFSLLQFDTLNTRLVFVLLEGVLSTLFGDAAMASVLRKLHTKSERVQRTNSI